MPAGGLRDVEIELEQVAVERRVPEAAAGEVHALGAEDAGRLAEAARVLLLLVRQAEVDGALVGRPSARTNPRAGRRGSASRPTWRSVPSPVPLMPKNRASAPSGTSRTSGSPRVTRSAAFITNSTTPSAGRFGSSTRSVTVSTCVAGSTAIVIECFGTAGQRRGERLSGGGRDERSHDGCQPQDASEKRSGMSDDHPGILSGEVTGRQRACRRLSPRRPRPGHLASTLTVDSAGKSLLGRRRPKRGGRPV